MARNLHGTDDSEILYGTSGHYPDGDAIWGYGGDDEIYAGNGWDYLTGGAGADYLDGGGAFDQAIYKDSPVGVTVFLSPGLGFGGTAEGDVLVNIENLAGSEYDDVLSGDGSRNELYGRNGNDTLKGGGGYDRLAGDAGNDILMGGADADYMHGGTGFDTASYEGSATGVFVSLSADSAAYGDAQGDTLDSIESLTGSRHGDHFIGDDGANVLNGLDGYDTLKGGGGADILYGGDHNDYLDGMEGADWLSGQAGHDTLCYSIGGAIDTLDGGDGTDTADFSGFGSAVWVGLDYAGLEAWTSGTSIANGANAWTEIANLDNIENVIGTSGSDTIFGNAGDNAYGFTGNTSGVVDYFDGRDGNDTVDCSAYTSAVWVGLDYAGVEAWTSGTSTATGANAWTEIANLDNVENIVGSAFNDTLIGSSGANCIASGFGNDVLTGGAGLDTFAFNTTLSVTDNVDRITDFSVVDDTIHLDNAVFSALTDGALAAWALHVGSAAADADDRIVYNSHTGALLYDADGSGAGAAVQFCQLSAGLGLSTNDFFVI